MSRIKTYVSEAEVAEAVAAAHRLEVGMLSTRIERLVAIIREHGLPLPGEDPRLGASDGDHLAACRRVVTAAYDLLLNIEELEEALCELKSSVGTSKELNTTKSFREERPAP